MVYGGKIDLTEENAINVISLVGLELNTEEDALKKAIIVKLKVNEEESLKTKPAGTTQTYSLGLIDEEDCYVYVQLEEDGTTKTKTYKISPILDAQVNILKGTNELEGVDGELLLSVKQRLPYNGKLQDLVEEVPEGASSYPGIEFLMVPASKYRAFYTALRALPENTPGRPGWRNSQQWRDNPTNWTTVAQLEDKNLPEGYAWGVELPQGKDVDNYYIWARAAADNVDNNYDGGPATWIGTASIIKSDPIFEGTIDIADVYYVQTTRGNWKGLHGQITPTGTFTVKALEDQDGTLVDPDDIAFRVQKGTLSEDGKTFTPDGDPQRLTGNGGNVIRSFEVGTYRIIARFDGDESFDEVPARESDVWKAFEVKRPSVTITTLPASQTLGYGVEPTFDYDVKGWTGYEGTLTEPTEAAYNVFDKDGEDYDIRPLEIGSYTVEVDKTGFSAGADFDIEVEAASVYVSPGEILAYIDDQTLVYGETLPLTLKYDDGAFAPTDTEGIAEFESHIWQSGFKATMIKDAEGNAVTGAEVKDLTATVRNMGMFGTFVTTEPNLPVGTYKVSMDKVEGNNDLYVASGEWTITPKDINDTEIFGMGNNTQNPFDSFNLSKTYTSYQIVPGEKLEDGTYETSLDNKFRYTIIGAMFTTQINETLVNGTDFVVINPGENINAGEGAGTFTVKGIGNYTGEKELTFDIDKAVLEVYPVSDPEQEWTIGAEEEYVIDWANIKQQLYDNFGNDRKMELPTTTIAGFKDLKVQRIVGATVGRYEEGIEAYLDGEEADNYVFDCKTAPLIINPGLIQLQLAAQTSQYKGNAVPTFNEAEFEVANADDLNPIIVENWKSVVKKNNEITVKETNFDSMKDDEGRYPAGTGYTITYNEIPEGTFTATNYNVEVIGGLTANLEVTKAPVTLTAKDSGLAYDDDFDKAIAALETVTGSTIVTAAPTLYTPDELTDVLATIAIDTENSEIVTVMDEETGKEKQLLAYDITLTAAENDNYDITTVDGKLYVEPLDGITLYSEADEFVVDKYGDPILDKDGNPIIEKPGDLTRITELNGAPVGFVNIYIKQPSINKNGEETPITWEPDQWYSLVLPFDATVREISSAFGYAIVNVADPEATTEKNVMFKLQKIDAIVRANTPFCLKTDEKINTEGEGYLAEFPGIHTIVLPEGGKPSVDVALGYTFDGTYEDMTIDNSLSYLRFLYNDGWKYVGKSSSTVFTLKPYTGYVNLGESNAARNVTFTFEEADGTTTSIDAVDFMSGKTNVDAEGVYNLNGIKLQGAPTQKGVYIQKGQKVIVK